jgi:hypothetical protein
MIASPTLTRTPARTTVESATATVYVPRRFRIGALEGIRQGSAIVGTPQGDGTVVIDVESTPYVEPSPARWNTWIAEGARRRLAGDEEELMEGDGPPARLVAEADLIAIGRYAQDHLTLTAEGRAYLQRWIEAGRAAYVADGYLSPEFT